MKKYLPIILILIIIFTGALALVTNKANKEIMNGKPIQSHRSYTMNLISNTNNLYPNKQFEIKFIIKDETGTVLKDFAIDHTKLMHFIVVRDDLQGFQHLHPDFNQSTGEFTVPVTFADNGKYRLFADFFPANGQKDSQGNPLTVIASKDVSVGDISSYVLQDVVVDTQATKNVGDYQITYSLPPSITSGQPISLTMSVTKNGQPVSDMEEYLGAQAHGILFAKDSLDISHLHAMGDTMTHMMGEKMMTMEGGMSKGPEIKFDYTFPTAGVYKLFTQFQHQGKVITAAYTFEVK